MSIRMDKTSPTEYSVILPTLFYPHLLKVAFHFYASGAGGSSDIAYIKPYTSIHKIDRNEEVEVIELRETGTKGKKELYIKTHWPVGIPRHGFVVEVYKLMKNMDEQ